MFTTDSKLVLGLAVALGLAAAAYSAVTGDRVGGIVLAAGAAAAIFVGAMLTGRVVPAGADVTVPAPNRDSQPLAPTIWPMLAAAAVVLFVVGITIDVQTLFLGLVAVAVAGAGWFWQAFRERRPQSDPAAVYAGERILEPTGLPLLALVGIAVVVVSMSRILLAVSKDASVAVAIAAAAGVFVVAMVISSRRAVSGRALGWLLALAAVLLGAGAVVAASNGERTITPEHGNPVATETAKGTAFTQKTLTVSTQTDRVVVHFRNEDADVIHNMAFYKDDSAKDEIYFGRDLLTVGETTYVFKVPGPGEYFYRCEFHPTQMTGTLKVEEPAHES